MGGLVGDINRLSATHVVAGIVAHRAVENVGHLTDRLPQVVTRVPLRSRAGSRRLSVALELIRTEVNLVEESVVLGIARGCVGTSGAHRRSVPARRGRRAGHEALLFLQHDQDGFLTDSAGFTDLVNDGGSGFIGGTLVGGAHGITRDRARRFCVVLEADIPTRTRRNLGVKESLNLGGAHGVAVEEEFVRNDVARLELRHVGGLCPGGHRSHGHEQSHGECENTHRGDSRARKQTGEQTHTRNTNSLIESFLGIKSLCEPRFGKG